MRVRKLAPMAIDACDLYFAFPEHMRLYVDFICFDFTEFGNSLRTQESVTLLGFGDT